jgi:NAD(P)-dependent dehydrogenase (short-subunit alcohol dehydrogenase family)
MTPFRSDYLLTPAEDYRRSFEVNVIAPIRITYRVLPSMRRRGWGRIVQVTSGIQDQPELMAYAASKAALDKFVRDTVPSLRLRAFSIGRGATATAVKSLGFLSFIVVTFRTCASPQVGPSPAGEPPLPPSLRPSSA